MATRWSEADLSAFQARTRSNASASTARVPSASQAPLKYRNRKVTDATGAVHDSTKEFRRWQVLELRERAGEIRSLRRQVPYALVVNGVLVCSYVADFDYLEGEAHVTEDVKSEPTRKLAAYRIKKKLFAALHGRDIHEV